MRQVEAEVNGGFPHFGLQVARLCDDVLHCGHELCFDLVWLQVSEVGWQCLLDKL